MFRVKVKKNTLFSKMFLFGILTVLLIILSCGFGASYNLKRSENTLVLADFNHDVEKPVSLELTPHGPIDINSDGDFITSGFPGIGTETDPYIIEGYSINTTDQYGIRIEYTSSFFIIRNCYVDAENYGISIYSTTEGTATIINNTCTNSLYGIILRYSSGANITNNTCTNNRGGGGISLSSSSCSCLVKYNLLQENEGFGVQISRSSDGNIIHHNNFVDNNIWSDSQAQDDGKKNQWYDPELKEGNYWSDLGTKCTYKIDGKANSIDMYPLNRALDCPTNPEVIRIITIVIPLLCSVCVLAFVVPKYAIPFTRNTIIPYYRKRDAERPLRIAKISSCPNCDCIMKSTATFCFSCKTAIPKRSIFTNLRLKIMESKNNRITVNIYLICFLLSIIIAPWVITPGQPSVGWMVYGLFGFLAVLLPLAYIILLVLFCQEIGRMKLWKKVPLIIMSVAFIGAMVSSPWWLIILILGHGF